MSDKNYRIVSADEIETKLRMAIIEQISTARLRELAEAERETEPVPLTCDGCQNLPNKYGSGVYMNAPCRICVRGITTHDFYKAATEPKGDAET